MTNPVSSNSSVAKQTQASLNQMNELANQMKNISNIGNMLGVGNIMGQIGSLPTSGIVGMLGNIIPNSTGSVSNAQSMNQMMENISQMTKKAENVTNQKAGIPNSESSKGNSQEKMEAAKKDAQSKAQEASNAMKTATSQDSINKANNEIVGGFKTMQQQLPSIMGQVSGAITAISGISSQVANITKNVPMVGGGFGGGLNL